MIFGINPLIALGVLASTAATDAAYVFFNAAVTGRRRIWAANWSANQRAYYDLNPVGSRHTHYSLNGHIEVEGDQAQARWYLFMPCTVAAGNEAMWRAGIDHETYARVDGAWMFRHKRSEPLMNVLFETGWARTRFA